MTLAPRWSVPLLFVLGVTACDGGGDDPGDDGGVVDAAVDAAVDAGMDASANPEVCNNNIDDDLNGQTDCADAACINDAACQGAGTLSVINLGAAPTGQVRTFTIPAGAIGFTVLVEGDAGND